MYNFNNQDSGCTSCVMAQPTYQQCNNVVQTYNYQDVPHVTNYHTHTVNNCIKRHINIPTYTASQETVYVDEYVSGAPTYQNQPIYNQGMNQPIYYSNTQYQGNVDTEGFSNQMTQNGFYGYNPMIQPYNM